MNAERAPKIRPYWHVDAKWITGLILVVVLSLALLAYTLAQVTAEKPAMSAMSLALALAFSEKGLDDASEIAEFRQKLRSSPDQSIQPIPGLRITVSESEIANLSPREARLLLMRKLAEPIYRGGTQGLADLATDMETRQSITDGGGVLNLLTAQTHQRLGDLVRVLAVVSALLFVLLIYFSYRFGRLGSPGVVLVVAALPGAAFFGLVGASPLAVATPPAREAGMTALASYVAANVLPPLAQTVVRTYLISVVVGLALIVIAIVGNIVWALGRRSS